MNKIQKIIKLAGLIAKYTSGQATLEEVGKLNSWQKRSVKNAKVFNKIVDWDNFHDRTQTWESFDVESAWSRFENRVGKKQPRFRAKQLLRYAAVIMAPVIIGGAIFYYLNITQPSTSEKLSAIKPGTQSAVIVLGSGKSIKLEEGGVNELIEEDGSVIQNSKGELSYNDIKHGEAKKKLQNTLIVPRGGEYSLVLSDGSRVFLNSISKISYPVVFDGGKREVTLEGEAYFEIKKDENRPFYVHLNGMKIKVLGTSFNIKAYNNEEEIYTTLVEGKIELGADGGDNGWVIEPGQQAVLEKEGNNLFVREVDVTQFTGWKNGIYLFTGQPLEEIMKTLSRWYDFEYEFASNEIRYLRFDGGLNKYKNIYPILDIIQSTGGVDYKIEGKKITFMQN